MGPLQGMTEDELAYCILTVFDDTATAGDVDKVVINQLSCRDRSLHELATEGRVESFDTIIVLAPASGEELVLRGHACANIWYCMSICYVMCLYVMCLFLCLSACVVCM